MSVTVSKPLYCCNCGSLLTWQEMMVPAWFADICDACASFTLHELQKEDRRHSLPDSPEAPNDGWRYEE